MKSGCHIYVGQPVLYQRVRRQEEKAMNLKGRNFLKLMDFDTRRNPLYDGSGSRPESKEETGYFA